MVGEDNNSFGPMSLLRAVRSAIVHRCQCAGVDYSSSVNLGPIQRANNDQLRIVFNKYASRTKNGSQFMTPEDFVRNFLGIYQEANYNREAVKIISNAADSTKDGLISFDEFTAFEALLCSPDALYLIAFEMFDWNGSETITFDEFERIIRLTHQPFMDFDFNCKFIQRYFGAKKKRTIHYLDFCQLLHDFYDEQAKQAFMKYDKDQDGHITAAEFQHIMTTVKSHLLTPFVRDNLIAVSTVAGGHKVTFPYYAAFNSLLGKIELLKLIYLAVAKGNLGTEMSKSEFLQAAQSYGQVTPNEVNILFHFADLAHPGRRTVTIDDFDRIDSEHSKRVSYVHRLTNVKASSKEERGVLIQVLEQIYRFTVGAVAGGAGATAVYPIDLVKTRMQNQRISRSFVGELLYKNSFDCFRKVIRHEGVLGLYRGLLPQIMGVAPEKAIKLTTNDFIRDKFTTTGGHIPLIGEIIAGGCGGASQVLFTNPIEIIKIRLQVAGEIAAGPKVNLFSVLKDIGFSGLYRGARACFLRDIPFSAIYFPVYAHLKLFTADANGHNNPWSLFISAFLSGVPAAALVTPADVIKTRLQVAARAGQTTYTGMVDCYRKVMKEEGWTAFWKGSGARVCRSSPQFAVTLLTYELMQRIFYVDFGGSHPTGSEVSAHVTRSDSASDNPDHIGGYRLCQATFGGIESKFGLFLPRFESKAKPAYAIQ